MSAVYRVEQTTVWTVRADSEQAIQDFIDNNGGVEKLGDEDSIEDSISETSEVHAGIDLADLVDDDPEDDVDESEPDADGPEVSPGTPTLDPARAALTQLIERASLSMASSRYAIDPRGVVNREPQV